MFKKIMAGAILGLMSIGLTMGIVGASYTQEVKYTAVEVLHDASDFVVDALSVPKTKAYTFSSASGITIESQDVTAVTDSALVGIASFFQILKFVGLAILLGVAVFIVNKIFSIAKIGS